MFDVVLALDQELLDQAKQSLRRALATHEPLLVLLSGGSAAALGAVLVEQAALGGLDQVMVGLVDERYGAVDHAASNARALAEGCNLWQVLAAHGVEARPILTGRGIDEEVWGYEAWLRKALTLCPRRLGILGIGADGHIAGMLPLSEELFTRTFTIDHLVVGYDAPGPYRQRITLSPSGLSQLTEVMVYAIGSEKRTALEQALYQEPTPPLYKTPAALLRTLSRVTIFTDQILGDSA